MTALTAAAVHLPEGHAQPIEPPPVQAEPAEADHDEDQNKDQPRVAPREQSQKQSQDQEKLDLGEGEVIVVTGSRYERPLAAATVATEVITRREIESSGGNSVAEVLATHPGLDVTPVLRGTSIRIQGLNPDYVLVLVDGQRTIGRIDGAIDLERFPIDSIERIEVVKGTSSALYGSDALAGVINIITRQAQKPLEGQVQARYGSLNTLTLSAVAGARQAGWNTRLSTGYRSGDSYDLRPEDISTTSSAFDEWNVSGSSNGAIGPVKLTFAGDYLRADLHGIDLDATINRQDPAVLDRLNRVEQASGSVRAEWRPARSQRLSGGARLALYRDQFAYDLRGSTEEMQDIYEETKERLIEANVQFDSAIGDRHFVTVGLEGMSENIDSPRIQDSEIGDTAVDRQRLALFAKDEWSVVSAPAVTLSPGFRLDADTQFGFHPTPKLALRWDASERVVARASYGWGYRAPSFKDLYLCFENPGAGYAIAGNTDLDPESSQNVSLGVELRAHERVWASANVYYNNIDDLIAIEEVMPGEPGVGPSACGPGSTQRFSYVNVASAFTRGIETQVRVRPELGPIDGLMVEVSYVLNDTRDRQENRPLHNRARHRGTFKLSYQHDGIGFDAMVRGSIVGKRKNFVDFADGTTETITTDPYISMDTRVAQSLGKRFTVFAGVSNIFDQGDAIYLPIPPRTFYGGMSAKY